ncbi:hypothetical protein SERLA73DRAFT_156343 [Serpula lacrymans var. lacrymans S7.3]|uniref:Uncharacterized protein n=1 Tax=Serpula lacrymans var. lacrymans (strain S7.3) TaxID=936435 RepID=F8QE26_SERL3|nr:hypothetical protein SERLA73DRAFT_156343 [Serpula lacrymans var. lacrymans S7.3]
MYVKEMSHWSDGITNDKYNARLKRAGAVFIRKNPRALFDKLGEIEAKISQRIATGNFKSQKGNDHFWMKHCYAIAVKSEQAGSIDLTKQQKTQTCSRCCITKYPGGTGSQDNHKKMFCSDGVMIKPEGIFSNGLFFYPVAFLSALCNMYYATIIQGIDGSPGNQIEHHAFAMMFVKYIKAGPDGADPVSPSITAKQSHVKST